MTTNAKLYRLLESNLRHQQLIKDGIVARQEELLEVQREENQILYEIGQTVFNPMAVWEQIYDKLQEERRARIRARAQEEERLSSENNPEGNDQARACRSGAD